MTKITITKRFGYVLPGDVHPTVFEPGEQELDDEVAAYAAAVGCAKAPAKARGAAPRNKAKGEAPSAK